MLLRFTLNAVVLPGLLAFSLLGCNVISTSNVDTNAVIQVIESRGFPVKNVTVETNILHIFMSTGFFDIQPGLAPINREKAIAAAAYRHASTLEAVHVTWDDGSTFVHKMEDVIAYSEGQLTYEQYIQFQEISAGW